MRKTDIQSAGCREEKENQQHAERKKQGEREDRWGCRDAGLDVSRETENNEVKEWSEWRWGEDEEVNGERVGGKQKTQTPDPTSPNCWWLRHLLPLTANHLHPGGSKARHGQKKGSKVKEHVQEGWSWYKEQQNVLWHRTKRLEYKSKAVKAVRCKNNNKIFPTEERCSKGCSRLHPS